MATPLHGIEHEVPVDFIDFLAQQRATSPAEARARLEDWLRDYKPTPATRGVYAVVSVVDVVEAG
jgi:hypothetical protein